MNEDLEFKKNVLEFMEKSHSVMNDLKDAIVATNARIDLIGKAVKNGNSNRN